MARTPAPAPTGITTGTRDLSGDIWVSGIGALWRWDGRRSTPIALPIELRSAVFRTIARDREGDLWVVADRRGVFRRRGTKWTRYDGPDAFALSLAADSLGRTWIGFADGHLIRDGQGQATRYGAGDGLRVGGILSLATQGRRLWAGGDLGVAVMTDVQRGVADSGTSRPKFITLKLADGVLRGVIDVVPTGGDLWMQYADGVARLDSAEIVRALRDSNYRVRAERFDARDRVDGSAVLGLSPTMVRGTNGHLWFSWSAGVGWIDPSHIRRNLVPPPVVVRTVVAAGSAYTVSDSVTLPKRTRALSVSYTALSLAVPERVRFRYRFIGLDTTWEDAGTRREAFFTNLAPGAYRFEVTAANDDGVWSVAPAAVDILIPPTFVQTNAFLAFCAVATLGAVWLLIVWRQARIAAAMRARFDARIAERTRVARELHDTLLTDVAGIRMQLDAVARVTGPRGIGATIAAIRDQANQAVVNARQAVVAMRTPAETTQTIDEQLADAARRIFADTSVTARLSHTGIQRRYSQTIETEAFRIGVEALTNCRNHADCRTVTATCAYSRDALRLEVHDDGRGFDPAQASENGHFGLVGMRERAAAIGARFTVSSAAGQGTKIAVVIPSESAL